MLFGIRAELREKKVATGMFLRSLFCKVLLDAIFALPFTWTWHYYFLHLFLALRTQKRSRGLNSAQLCSCFGHTASTNASILICPHPLQLETAGDCYLVSGGIMKSPQPSANGFSTIVEEHEAEDPAESAKRVMEFAFRALETASTVRICVLCLCNVSVHSEDLCALFVQCVSAIIEEHKAEDPGESAKRVMEFAFRALEASMQVPISFQF
mgnify:CR=1 FL=1